MFNRGIVEPWKRLSSSSTPQHFNSFTKQQFHSSTVPGMTMTEYLFAYERLDVWQLAKDFAVALYKITDGFPREERYGLVSQMNRAAVSVASNIGG